MVFNATVVITIKFTTRQTETPDNSPLAEQACVAVIFCAMNRTRMYNQDGQLLSQCWRLLIVNCPGWPCVSVVNHPCSNAQAHIFDPNQNMKPNKWDTVKIWSQTSGEDWVVFVKQSNKKGRLSSNSKHWFTTIIWRKVPESDARSVVLPLPSSRVMNTWLSPALFALWERSVEESQSHGCNCSVPMDANLSSSDNESAISAGSGSFFLTGWHRQGPYAWVQGRRATSKVTATSRGRLTNRYAWATGRLTRRACLGVNLPLRVPPCKHYPEEVTELKMAALILLRYRQRRLLRRNRIF